MKKIFMVLALLGAFLTTQSFAAGDTNSTGAAGTTKKMDGKKKDGKGKKDGKKSGKKRSDKNSTQAQ